MRQAASSWLSAEIMKARFLALAFSFVLFGSATVLTAAEDARFSRTLNSETSAALGLSQLTSDQTAVLDALIRRDIANLARLRPSEPRAARFSQRISADERANAGLTTLSETQLAQLDEQVQRFAAPPPSNASVASGQGSSGALIQAKTLRRPPEIHGSVSLMYGVGSGGYSERGGAMFLTYEDPASGLALGVGYSEVRTKGGRFWRDCGTGLYDSPWSSWR